MFTQNLSVSRRFKTHNFLGYVNKARVMCLSTLVQYTGKSPFLSYFFYLLKLLSSSVTFLTFVLGPKMKFSFQHSKYEQNHDLHG